MTMTMTEEQRKVFLAERATGLGGSDAAAICGVSPYSGPYKVWAEKKGLIPPTPSNDAMRWGNELEPHVISWAEDQLKAHGIARIDTNVPHLRHPVYDFMVAHLDGRGLDENGVPCAVIEAKTANSHMRDHWAEGVPIYYAMQCYHYMAVTGLKVAYVPVLIGTPHLELVDLVPGEALLSILQCFDYTLDVYRLERNDEIIETMIAAEAEFWQRYILGDEEPEPDATSSAKAVIEARYPRLERKTVELAPEMAEVLNEYSKAKASEDEAHKTCERIKNQIRAAMGSAKTATLGGRIVATNIEAFKNSLDLDAIKADHPEIDFANYTKTTTYRRINIRDL